MKYVIWGAGQLGKKALSIIGKENVICFVDKNEKLQDTIIDNVLVYNPKYLSKISEQYIILITPASYDDEIARELHRNGIENYLLFSDHPYCLDMSENSDISKTISNVSKLKGNIALYGITWFTLAIYDFLNTRGKKPVMFISGCENKTILEIIAKEYVVVKNENDLEYVDYILAPTGINGIPKEKYVDIEDYFEKTYPSVNTEIQKYKDIHKDQRCFIVATGPSLRVGDLEKLYENNEICISMNRIYNIFDKTVWRPDYYVIEDQKMIEDLSEEIANLELKHKFVSSCPQSYWKQEKAKTSIRYKMIMQDCLTDRVGFSLNPDRLIYNGYTVTYVCLQLALYMGFSEIFLLGVDFNYSDDVYAESNHFEGYQKKYKDIRLNPIEPERMKRAYIKAKTVAEMKNIHIYNATRGGKLEVFERINFDEVMQNE